jgi:DNA-binding response OmpR family regulator
MIDLLLLERPVGFPGELAANALGEGYKLLDVTDVISCCEKLQFELRRTQFRPFPMHDVQTPFENGPGQRALVPAPLNADPDTSSRMEQLRQCIVKLAQQLSPAWHLSMRHHCLDVPGGTSIPLTSLEFIFIKLFAMVEIGEAVSRKQIVTAFGEDYLTYDQNRIDTLVRRLRQKIKMHGGVTLPLNTERVRGFSFGDVLIIDQ